jgi:glycosyltransferase involved in cell wall biosynthesis
MKILLCSPAPLIKELGAPKIWIELAEAMEQLGWECKTISLQQLATIPKHLQNHQLSREIIFSEALRQYLREHAAEYDVIDYDQSYLPYSRSEFYPRTLFVARAALLVHHLEKINIPQPKTWKSKIRGLIKGKRDGIDKQKIAQLAHKTVTESDLVNVANYDDKDELVRCGIPAEKIIVIPYGISRSRRPLFDAISSEVPGEPKVVFVGTFDYRKGASDFPGIVENICDRIPNVTFRLLGTAGLFQTKEKVLSFFPNELKERIEVIPRFNAQELPELLNSCSVGIFPSYLESFGFGVLEMLAASIPVIAYNAPGPPMMLPSEYLVAPGDTESMSAKVIELLKDKSKLAQARVWAKERSQKFCWQEIAQHTTQVYLDRWRKIQMQSLD